MVQIPARPGGRWHVVKQAVYIYTGTDTQSLPPENDVSLVLLSSSLPLWYQSIRAIKHSRTKERETHFDTKHTVHISFTCL